MTSSILKDNGRLPRKTLASQLDRLDGILDGLADNLNDAVAGAAREAVLQVVRQAVQDAMQDALTLPVPPPPSTLPPPAAPPAASTSNWKDRVKAAWTSLRTVIAGITHQALRGVRRCGGWGLGKLQTLLAAPAVWLTRLASGCRQAGGRLGQWCWQQRKLAGIALAVGLVVGLGGYLAGPLAASCLTGLNTALLAASGRAALALRRLGWGADQA